MKLDDANLGSGLKPEEQLKNAALDRLQLPSPLNLIFKKGQCFLYKGRRLLTE